MRNMLTLLNTMILVFGIGLTTGTSEAADEKLLILDDFEAYTDVESFRIFDIWLDGWLDDANGSVVGNAEAPFAEQVIVHGGAQSMNFAYDNSSAMISTAERTFDEALDLTVGGTMEALTLWYQGRAGPVGGFTYDAAANTYAVAGNGAGIGEYADSFHFAYKSLNGDGSITVRVDSVEDTEAWAQAGIMIRETLTPDSRHAMVALTPRNRAQFVFRAGTGTVTGVTSTAKDSFSLPHWIRLTREGTRLKGEHSSNGTTWNAIESSDPVDPSQFHVPMSNSVYVGLVVSANREDGTPCEAMFSSVTINGAVAGPIAESTDIGIVSNAPDEVYRRINMRSATP